MSSVINTSADAETESALRQHLTRIKPWIVVAAILGFVLLGYYLFQGVRYWQAWDQASSLRDEVTKLQTTLNSTPSTDSALPEDLAAQQRRLGELKDLFTYIATDDLMGIVSETARASSVQVLSLAVGDEEEEILGDLTYQVLPMTLNISGATDNFIRFLSLLHQKVPVIVASRIRLSNLDSGPAANVQLLFHLSPERSGD